MSNDKNWEAIAREFDVLAQEAIRLLSTHGDQDKVVDLHRRLVALEMLAESKQCKDWLNKERK